MATVRPARPEEVPRLGEVEARASERFQGLISADVAASTVAPDELARSVAEGRVLVAADAKDRAIGFAYLIDVDGESHLEELDVVPEEGGRGLGTALLEAACALARSRGFRMLSLCTYRDIPWNAPFYLRRGFREVPLAEFSQAHRATFERERAKGYDMARRVIMVRALG